MMMVHYKKDLFVHMYDMIRRFSTMSSYNGGNMNNTAVNNSIKAIKNPYARKRSRLNPTQEQPVQGEPALQRTSYQPLQQQTLQQPLQQEQQRHEESPRLVHIPTSVNGNDAVESHAKTHVHPTSNYFTVHQEASTVQLAPDFSPTQNKQEEKRRSFSDSLIDWNEAIKVADTTVAQMEATSVANQFAVDPNKHSIKKPSCSVKTVQTAQSPVIDLTQEDAPNIKHQTSASLPPKPPPLNSHIENKKPPPVPRLAQKPPSSSPISRNGMASLRPSIWNRSNSNNNSTKETSTPVKNLTQQVFSQHGKLASPAGAHLDPIMATLPKELRFDKRKVQEPVQDSYRQDLVKHANLSAPLANGWTLFSHQKKAILRGLLMRRIILALDMGLGKTLVGCVWARSFQRTFDNLKIVVICPVSLKQEWTRTAVEATELRVEQEASKSKKMGKKKLADPWMEDTIYPSVEIHSWGKVPTSVDSTYDNYVVICDEAHSIQSIQAARTQDLLTLVKPERCVGVLLLTGTPMKNGKPTNLFPLLKAVRHPFGNHKIAYETHFCDGRHKHFGNKKVWDATGSSNLDQLRDLVSSHLLHLTKDDCLKNLPKSKREHKHVPISGRLDAKYAKELRNLARVFASSSSTENGEDAVLGALQIVRMLSAVAKVDATVEVAKKILEEEPAVVLFTTFVKVAKELHSKLASAGWPGELLTGETPAKKRQQMVDNFQEGISSVFVCTFGAGGVGLTLTAARTIILVDRPWTPGETHQAEDRIRRIGQTHAVKSIWMTAFEMDKQIDAMLEQKSQTSNTVLASGQSEPQATNGIAAPVPKISIFQFLRNVLPRLQANQGQNISCQAQEVGGLSLSQTSMHSYFGSS